MGIKDLAKVIGDHASSAIKENEMTSYFGRKIAIDASMSIYQFLIAVRQDGSQLQSESGETTSHLMGMFYRTIRLMENGIKPVYVFDGKPPELKSSELEKRDERRVESEKMHEKAVETGDVQAADKFSRRLVKVTKQHNEDCKRLLRHMGIPLIDAPSEAEAQCASMVQAGLVYATATEDMDTLTFGSDILLRHMAVSEARKLPIKEFNLNRILTEFGLNMDEFIDLCILLGCDYCGSIRGIGPKKAFELIGEQRCIENVLKNIDTKKYQPPENWNFDQARKLFKNPLILDPKEIQLKWAETDEEAVVQFMVKDNNFGEDRIRGALKRLTKAKGTSSQGRIDSFFTMIRSGTTEPTAAKRKAELDKKRTNKTAKKGKTQRSK